MAQARRKSEWGQTATLLALTANINRDPKKTEAFTPEKFMPVGLVEKPVQRPGDFMMLKMLMRVPVVKKT